MKEIELAVIINSYNRIHLLKESYGSLIQKMDEAIIPYALVIFDAGSTDGSLEWIGQEIKQASVPVTLIKPSAGENSSFSYGVNSACTFALNQYKHLKYFLLYETDNYLHSSLPIVQASKLLSENSDLAACGFTVKKHSGESAGFGCNFPSILSFCLGQQLSFFLKLDTPKIKWLKTNDYEYGFSEVVYTSPLLIKRSSWEKVKGFDMLSFPFSDCDIDLAYRIHLEGEKMAVILTDQLLHDNKEVKSLWSSTRTLNYYRARLVYFRKHYGNRIQLLKPLLFIMHVFEFSLLMILIVMGKRKAKSLGTRWALIKSVFFNYKSN